MLESVLDIAEDELQEINDRRKLSLGPADLIAIRDHFKSLNRNPTLVELEVIAQTWSEHCKHRIFNARITHRRGGETSTIHGLFKTYIQNVTDRIRRIKPDFVISAFDDNAGFIRVDDRWSVCAKVETHNHPSAIEPYCGSNTGLGGVIRDILGAGKGAKPAASLDAFCFGRPDAAAASLTGGMIHPLGVFRGVIRGVRDYGNRMGIPTVAGAIHFDDSYTHNPLVFCGTAGVIPIADIPKQVHPGLQIVVAGARTGRDVLHGATFSSASLTSDSIESDRQAVQIGNPIEEKKLLDFILAAREEHLIEFITDCGAGGLSSAVGEMVKDTGGKIDLDRVPLKEDGLSAWEIFLSESQERMVLAVEERHLARLCERAARYESECRVIGVVTDTNRLEVSHAGANVCDLAMDFLHTAPTKFLSSEYIEPRNGTTPKQAARPLGLVLKTLLGDANIASREVVIREYDFEVQGNTLLKPLAGAGGDNPQDGVVVRLDGSDKCVAIGVSLLPQYSLPDPYRMGQSSVDEAVRQVVVAGADPDRIALLDNFCVGNPDHPPELGRLVECVKSVSSVAEIYQTPFISGKDSFYNYFRTDRGEMKSIPVTALVTAVGIVDSKEFVTGASLRRPNTSLCLLGNTCRELGGSAYHRITGQNGTVPGLNPIRAIESYRRFYRCVQDHLILSAHDLSEGGLAVALCESAFSLQGGVELDLSRVERQGDLAPDEVLFSESNARILFEIDSHNAGKVQEIFSGLPFAVVGRTVSDHRRLIVRSWNVVLMDEDLEELKQTWKNGLKRFY